MGRSYMRRFVTLMYDHFCTHTGTHTDTCKARFKNIREPYQWRLGIEEDCFEIEEIEFCHTGQGKFRAPMMSAISFFFTPGRRAPKRYRAEPATEY